MKRLAPMKAPLACWREGIPAGLVRWRHPDPGVDPEQWAEDLVAQLGWTGPATIYVLDEPVVAPPMVVVPFKLGEDMATGEAATLDAVAAPAPWLMALFDAHGCVSVADLGRGSPSTFPRQRRRSPSEPRMGGR